MSVTIERIESSTYNEQVIISLIEYKLPYIRVLTLHKCKGTSVSIIENILSARIPARVFL
jgi:hypothetical protein